MLCQTTEKIINIAIGGVMSGNQSSQVLGYWLSEDAKARNLILKAPRIEDAGLDLPSLCDVQILPGEQLLVRTGIHLAIPQGWVGVIRDRSSMALAGATSVAGVIDSGYRGEVKVLMYNFSDKPLIIKTGDRIAQCLVLPHFDMSCIQEVPRLHDLGDTERSCGGFGSTGA